MSRLLAFGCSNTYGHGLRDICLPNKTIPDEKKGPSKSAWPQVLAELLGIECQNISWPGASCKWISYQSLNYDIKLDDIVIFMWTYTNRSCIISEDDTVTQLVRGKPAWDKWQRWRATTDDESVYDLKNDNMAWISTANHVVKYKTPNCFNFTCNNQTYKDLQEKYNVNFLHDFGEVIESNPKALDGEHPSEETHQLIAKQIYNTIEKRIK